MSAVPLGYRGALKLAARYDANPLLKALLAVPMPQSDGTVAFRAVPPRLQMTALIRAGFRVPLGNSHLERTHGISSVFWLLRLLRATEARFDTMGVPPPAPTEASSGLLSGAPSCSLNVTRATRHSLLLAHPSNLDDALCRGAFIVLSTSKKGAAVLQINKPTDSPVGDVLSTRHRKNHPRLCSLPLYLGGSDASAPQVVHSNHLMHYLLCARRNPLRAKVPAEPFYVTPLSAVLQLPTTIVATLTAKNCRVVAGRHVGTLEALAASGDFIVSPPVAVPNLLAAKDEWATAVSTIGGMGHQCGFLPPTTQTQRAALREARRALLEIDLGLPTPVLDDSSAVFLRTVNTLLATRL